MSQEQVLTGRDFHEIVENVAKVSATKKDVKKCPPSGVYIGFSASARTGTVYRARFDANAVELGDDNHISGMFEHSIYKRKDVLGDPTEVCKECFEGVWFPDEGRMLVRGVKWAEGSMNKELGIFKEHYDFYFKDDAMVGNWASGGKPGEPKLNDEAKFDQAMILQRIPGSVARMSQERANQYLAERNKYSVEHVFDLINSIDKDTEHRNVKVVLKVEAITGIEQVSQTFGAFFVVTFEWLPSLKDVYYLISGGTDDNWTPEWMPPTPFLVNRSQNTEEVVEGSHKLFQKDSGYVIRKSFTFNSILLESLELDKYPFDVQEFQIKMKIPDSKDVKFDVSPDLSDEVRSQLEELTESSEWEPQIWSTNVKMNEDSDRDGSFGFTLILRMKRAWSIYFWRIIFVMSLISLCSGFVVVIDPVGDFGDILGFLVTLFLAALAYSIVIAGYLPHLSYLTVLDKYIMWTFFYIVALMAAEVVMVNYSDEGDMKDNQYTIVESFYLFWVVWHVCYFIYMWICRRQEMKKLKTE